MVQHLIRVLQSYGSWTLSAGVVPAVPCSLRVYMYCVCVFQAVSLEKFRSLQDKLCLLDVSVSAHDGNVITAVTLFKLRFRTNFVTNSDHVSVCKLY